MVPVEQRGKLIGALMSGLLCGVLLARTLAGFVADHFGWRALYALAALLMLVLGFALSRSLPHRPPTLKMSYGRLMHSMLALLRTQPVLRRASLVSALSFAVFTAFWTVLSFLLMERFHQGSFGGGPLRGGRPDRCRRCAVGWQVDRPEGRGLHHRALAPARRSGVCTHGHLGDHHPSW